VSHSPDFVEPVPNIAAQYANFAPATAATAVFDLRLK
jgi:hypothetical protein